MDNVRVVTLKDVAKRAGCCHTTVSRALKNSPLLPLATRRRIQQLAKAMGYHVNPVVAKLMIQLRGIRRSQNREEIAWIYHHPVNEVELWNAAADAFQVASGRALELGYRLEPLWISPHRGDRAAIEFRGIQGMTIQQVNRYIHSRKIQGVLIAPWCRHDAFWPLRWENLAVISMGFTPFRPSLHHILPDDIHNSMLCVNQLKEHGYVRTGFVIAQKDLRVRPYLLDCYQNACRPMPALILADLEAKGERRFVEYIRKYQPDSLICADYTVKTWLKKMGKKIPGDMGLASIDVMSDPRTRDWAGIHLHSDRMAISAIELLVSELQNNRFGPPTFQKDLTIKGEWHHGTTLRVQTVLTPQTDSAAVIGILNGIPLHHEPYHSWRTLIQALEGEVSRMGLNAPKTKARQRPWICRIYDSLSPVSRNETSYIQNHQRLTDDLRYHDFKGWILVGVAEDQIPTSENIRMLPSVRYPVWANAVVMTDRTDFIRQSVLHLKSKGCRRICYLTHSSSSKEERPLLREVAAELDVEAWLVGIQYSKNLVKHDMMELERVRARETYEFTRQLTGHWKSNTKRPDGLIVWEDVAMRSVTRALVESEIRVPWELKVVTSASEGTDLNYALPVVRYEWPVRKTAQELVRILKCRIEGKREGQLPVVLRGKIVPHGLVGRV